MQESTLPADFDGLFRFTNFTDRDFTAKWDGVSYTFPALKMTPLIIPKESPEGIQSIRKKFAKELAEREFHTSQKMKTLEAQTPVGSVGSFHNASAYSPVDLEALAQQCLTPLPLDRAEVKIVPKQEVQLKTDEKGRTVTKIVDDGDKLVEGSLA